MRADLSLLPSPLLLVALGNELRFDGVWPAAGRIPAQFQFTDLNPASPSRAASFSVAITATGADLAAMHAGVVASFTGEEAAR